MKKFIILIISFILLVGCSKKAADDNKDVTADAVQKDTVAETAISVSTVKAEAEADIESLSDWQKAYREELYDFINSDEYIADESAFSIYDINNDGIPELFISRGLAHLFRCRVYTFIDRLIDLNEYGSFGTCGFYPNKNILCGGYTGQGVNFTSYFQLNKDGTVSELADFYDDSGRTPDAVYKINDIEVTEEEYKDKKAEYSDIDSHIALGRSLKLSEEIVDGVFNGASDWRECYKKLLCGLLSVMDDYSRFSLYDVTDDGIPELFISEGTSHPSSCYIYTFKNGPVYIDKLGTYGDLGFSPEQKLFTSSSLSQGYYSCGYKRLDKNFILQTKIHFFTNYGAAATEDERIYKINNEAVSYDEFKNTYEEYKEIDDFIWLGRDYAFTKEDIQKAFLEKN